MAKNKKKENSSIFGELEESKLELMRIRFRAVLGETVSSHSVRLARRNIAKCTRLIEAEAKGNGDIGGKNA